MAIAVVASHSQATLTGGTFTTSPIDTTGADLILVVVARYAGGVTLTDSEGNSPTQLTIEDNSGFQVRINYYPAPATDAAHTFTVTSVGSTYAAIAILAVSGAHASPFGAESAGGIASGTSVQPGSLTPSQDGCLLVTGLVFGASGTISIGSGYSKASTEYTSGTNMGVGLGWLIQGTAAAINPTWSFSGAGESAAAHAVFLPVGGAAPLVAGSAAMVTSGPDGIEVESPAATGGSPAYSYQWQRNADGGSWANISNGGGVTGATTLTLFDGSATEGVLYGYRIVVTDIDTTVDTGDPVYVEVYEGGPLAGGGGGAGNMTGGFQ